ncbi:MAG TPA: hypothetical protein VNA15_08320 [Candidatus Angelobacter sp.]|nr:hypothetical protein [Candidatus Angelobacter sp.]
MRVVKRELDYYQKLPADLLEQLNKATVEAAVPWRDARKKADFRIFQPHLEKDNRSKAATSGISQRGHTSIQRAVGSLRGRLTVDDLDKIFSALIP